MTSTVLDVTLLLLCVSASVVALGGIDGGPASETDGSAADAADRLVTETATVTYEVAGESHDSRTVHATLAELLVMAVEERDSDPELGELRTDGRFRSGAIEAVEHAMGPHTRVDVRYGTGGPANVSGRRTSKETEERTAYREEATVEVGPEPPSDATVSTAVVTHPASGGVDGSEPGRFRIVVRTWHQ